MLMKCNTVSQLTGIAYHTKALNGFGALQFAPPTPDRSISRKQTKKQKKKRFYTAGLCHCASH